MKPLAMPAAAVVLSGILSGTIMHGCRPLPLRASQRALLKQQAAGE